jgi:N-acetylglutamate synthase-like GNAT family acetyltransferase
MNATFRIRRARDADEYAIHSLVRSERLNPIDLDWRRFLLAIDENGIAGAVQLRLHDDDSRELGSLVVRQDRRGYGVAARLIDTLLAPIATRVCMITGAVFAHHYARWGFRRIDARAAPWGVRRNYYFGRFIGRALALLGGREPRELVILDRAPRAA